MKKHTEGPWQVMPEEVDKSYIRVRGTRFGGRYKIADVPTPIFLGVNSGEAEETRANARLIAAAPELLCALENLVRAIESGGIDLEETHIGHLVEKAKEVISCVEAKA